MGFFQQIREFAHRYDPIGANVVDNAIRSDSRLVAEVSRGSDRVSQAIGLGGLTDPAGRTIRRESRANIADPSRAVGRAAATVALMYGFGAMAGGGTAAGAGEVTALGEAGGYAYGGGSGSGATALGEAGGYGAAGGATVGGGTGSVVPDYELWRDAGYFRDGAEVVAGGAGGAEATSRGGGTNPSGNPSGTNPNPQPSPYRRAAESLAVGVGTNVATSLLMPKPKQPAIEPVTEMPDPEAQALARRRKAAMKSRQGRTASILTSGG